MTSRPAPQDDPAPQDPAPQDDRASQDDRAPQHAPSLRLAAIADAGALALLSTQTPGAPQWPLQTFRDLPSQPNRYTLVLVIQGRIVGYAVGALLPPAPFEAELEAIVIHPEMQRRGYGRTLLQAVQNWCRHRQATTLRLEVRASNLAAAQLYMAAGFFTAGRRPGYYRAPPEDAVLMQWSPGLSTSAGALDA